MVDSLEKIIIVSMRLSKLLVNLSAPTLSHKLIEMEHKMKHGIDTFLTIDVRHIEDKIPK